MGGDYRPYTQLIIGGGEMRAREAMHGVPGTTLFRYEDRSRGHFMQHAAQVPFPAGTVRNLRFAIRLDRHATEGDIDIALLSRSQEGAGATSEGTGISLKLEPRQVGGSSELRFSGSNTLKSFVVPEGDGLSIKVENNFVGPALIGFTYSFEFEPA